VNEEEPNPLPNCYLHLTLEVQSHYSRTLFACNKSKCNAEDSGETRSVDGFPVRVADGTYYYPCLNLESGVFRLISVEEEDF
jgi:hypothetical protein